MDTIDKARPATLMPTLLQMARAERSADFWRLACTYLTRLISAEVVVVHADTGVALLEHRAAGRPLVEVADPKAAFDLTFSRIHNEIGMTLNEGVRRVTFSRLRRTSAFHNPLLRRHDCAEAFALCFDTESSSGVVCVTMFRSKVDRQREQPALQALRAAFPALSRAFATHHRQMVQRNLAMTMGDLLAGLPVGLALFDWQMELIYANDEAYRLAQRWVSDRPLPRRKRVELRKEFPDIRVIQDAMRILATRMAWHDDTRDGQVTLQHPQLPGLKATIGRHSRADRRLDPMTFVVRFSLSGSVPRSSLLDSGSHELAILAQLSPTERSVAVLAMRGMKNAEIAETLHREVSTVKDHLTRVFSKLGVRNRTELASLAAPAAAFNETAAASKRLPSSGSR